MKHEVDSKDGQGDGYRNERFVILSEEVENGGEMVTMDEEE